MAAQAVVVQEFNGFQNLKKIKWAWTCTNAGVVTGVTTVNKFTGVLERLVTVPDAVSAPTDNYDVAINDSDGLDVLMGAGVNRDTANTEQVLASSLGCCLDSKLTLEITNAGNATKGVVYLYIKP